jgi:hypothetical protein
LGDASSVVKLSVEVAGKVLETRLGKNVECGRFPSVAEGDEAVFDL